MLGNRNVVGRAVSCALFLGSLLSATAAWAVPSYDKLKDGNFGYVTASLQSTSGGNYTYLFTVTDTSSSPIKGVLVYGGDVPVAMSQVGSTESKFQGNHDYAWWDINGPTSNYLQPGQTAPTNRPDLVFTLTYNHPVDPSQFCYAFHVVGPEKGGGGAFFRANSAICGEVVCNGSDGAHAIAGATVQLVDANDTAHVLITTTADANGNFALVPPGPGAYEVCASDAPDYLQSCSTPFNFTNTGCDTCVTLALQPAPITTTASNDLRGVMYFSDTTGYRKLADPTITLTTSDLANPNYVFSAANGFHTYRFQGSIPGFGDLGKPVWVCIIQSMLPEDRYTGHSFVNLCGVQDGIGTDPNRVEGPYTESMLYCLPITGGTAYNCHTTGFQVAYHTTDTVTLAGPTWTELTTVHTDGSCGTTPPAGQVPSGFMARTRVKIRVPAGVSWTGWATTQFQNVCGGSQSVRVDPLVPAAP